MNRDLVLHHLVALDAQIRRVCALARSIGDAEELRARLPRLLDETARTSQRALSAIARPEGWQTTSAAPIAAEAGPARPD